MSERPFDSAQGALPAVADTGRMIQVGVTALRDPVTGEFLPAVPLFIREEDAKNPAFPHTDGGLMKELSAKMKEYHAGLKVLRGSTGAAQDAARDTRA